ncbi:CPBP family intramembrane glutamic endopeptidase [Paractinoplanes rhizophilus]|uniref:CPBP family intramembrane glutamic endopeptidase n=1 Tax=Paractinoplanes rhizophilus TaxID=1416877 RepID=A0ABW2I1E5_9ACTN
MKTQIIQEPPRETTRNGLAEWITRHRLTSFFVLAYVLAWWSWPLYRLDVWPRQEFQAIGALLAALIVIAVADGRAGFRDLGRRMIRWRVPWYFYAFALLVPVVLRFGVSAVNSAPGPAWSDLAWGSFALTFLVRLVNPMDGPMAEEPAWRGFAVPRLQRDLSPLASAAVLGVLVALWHLPLLGDVGPAGLVATFVITFVYVWLFNRTGGSVLLVLLFHNAQGFLTMTDLGYRGADLSRQEWYECAAWTVVALALILADRAAWRSGREHA